LRTEKPSHALSEVASVISGGIKLLRMNSLALKKIGFSDFLPLSTLSFSNLPQNKGIVFAVLDTTLYGKPETDILYIGRAKTPARKLLGSLIGGYGGKSGKKINAKLLNEGYMEKAAVGWILSDDPRVMQKELMDNFNREEAKYPSWNVSKKLTAKPKAPEIKKKTSRPPPARKSVS
jgi:hypothetical protein